MINYIDENKDQFGVVPIWRELPIPPQKHYPAKIRPPSQRSIRIEQAAVKIHAVQVENYRVYGARKVHALLRRKGHPVARCSVERLMRREGLRGVARRKGLKTAILGPFSERPTDLGDRRFATSAPDGL
jgi:putative transposase